MAKPRRRRLSGQIVAQRRLGGRPLPVQDAVIASISWVHRASLATRNVKDFDDCDIVVINPFEP